MKWSWRIGSIAGIDILVHGTFVLLLLWVGVSHYLPRHSLGDVGSGIVFILALFAIVVLHELGHALTARRFGIRARDITLLPIGGVARLERMPEDPRQELLVAIAGPAVNAVLAVAFFLILAPVGGVGPFREFSLVGGDFLGKLFWINVSLAVFNLIPAFPMDGGRVLRALLAMRGDYVRATQTAAGIGQGIALFLGFAGLFTNPFLVFIALFVWMGASAEASTVQLRSALAGIPVSRAMISEFRTLRPTDTLDDGVRYILAGFQQDFPVVDGEGVVGVLTRSGLLKVLADRGPTTPVSEAMERSFETAEANEMLASALNRLEACKCHALPVLSAGRLVGILTMDNVGEFLLVHAAAGGRRSTSTLVDA